MSVLEIDEFATIEDKADSFNNMTLFDNHMMEHYKQLLRLEEQRVKCEEIIVKTEITKGYCHVHWDGLLCWPKIPKSTTRHLPCPDYVTDFNLEGFATRHCTDQGQWYIKDQGSNQTWTNYTMCLMHYVPHPDYVELNETSLHANVKFISLISKIGYSSSFITLITAFMILFLVKKLRCPRNRLHLHLFASFMLRAWTVLTRGLFFSQPNDKTVTCKVFTCFWHYTLMANYSWILMEGLYLHNLVFLAVFRDASGIGPYVIMGWALPLFFLIPWSVIRAIFEDEMCWIRNTRQDIFWIIRGPITTSIVLNFLIFVNITRVLLIKMFLPQAPQTKRYKYRKWFKSTLVLVPLFGVHYALTLGISFAAEFSHVAEIIWLYIDQIFSSFQGFLVALLYCFLNGEVRSELRKAWQRWKRQSDKFYSHTSLFTSNTHISKNRGSVHSLQSNTVSAERHELNPSPRNSTCTGGASNTVVSFIPKSSSLSPAVITTLAGVQSHNSSVRKQKNRYMASSINSMTEDSNSGTMNSKDFSISTESGTLSLGKSDRHCLSLPCNGKKRRRSLSSDDKNFVALMDLRGRSNTLTEGSGIGRSKAWKSDALSPGSSDSSVLL